MIVKNYEILNEMLDDFDIDQLRFFEEDWHIILKLNIYGEGKWIEMCRWEYDEQLVKWCDDPETAFPYNIFERCRKWTIKDSADLYFHQILFEKTRKWVKIVAECESIDEIRLKLQLIGK
jgi:hypothetical protein